MAPFLLELEDSKLKKLSGNGMSLPCLGSFFLFVLAFTVRREIPDIRKEMHVVEDDFDIVHAKPDITEDESREGQEEEASQVVGDEGEDQTEEEAADVVGDEGEESEEGDSRRDEDASNVTGNDHPEAAEHAASPSRSDLPRFSDFPANRAQIPSSWLGEPF